MGTQLAMAHCAKLMHEGNIIGCSYVLFHLELHLILTYIKLALLGVMVSSSWLWLLMELVLLVISLVITYLCFKNGVDSSLGKASLLVLGLFFF